MIFYMKYIYISRTQCRKKYINVKIISEYNKGIAEKDLEAKFEKLNLWMKRHKGNIRTCLSNNLRKKSAKFPYTKMKINNYVIVYINIYMGSEGGSDRREFACNAGNRGSNSGLGRSPGEGKGNPLHYSCLENSTARGVWQATVHWVAKSWT